MLEYYEEKKTYYNERLSCVKCSKGLGYVNGQWLDGGIMSVCFECYEKLK